MTKWIALALLTLGLGACSSGSKKSAEKAETAAEEATEDAKAEAKNTKKEASKSMEGKTLCEMKSDKRYIEVTSKDKGCELLYTKFDKEEVIASSAVGTSHCEKISERIQSNLKEAGFSCGN